MDKKTKDALKMFNEYDRACFNIGQKLSTGASSGIGEVTIERKRYHNVTPEMEKYFDGKDSFKFKYQWQVSFS